MNPTNNKKSTSKDSVCEGNKGFEEARWHDFGSVSNSLCDSGVTEKAIHRTHVSIESRAAVILQDCHGDSLILEALAKPDGIAL